MRFTIASLLALAPLVAQASPVPVQRSVDALMGNQTGRAIMNDPFEDYKGNIFWIYSDLTVPDVYFERWCDGARAAIAWLNTNDLSGKGHRGVRWFAPGVGPQAPPRAMEIKTNKVQFTLYETRGPWEILDTWNESNGRCVPDTSGKYDCGKPKGLSVFKCVGWAPPYNLEGMN
ncbi:hypothetical protein PG994_007266 [Apiospora phragmitis]|uniref:Uncharacterized protein n=1 Tax=Apiospora phragmitis TaxID=2905665 RepID=A0ABR1V0F1_9PEZI